ncbi:phosphoribosylformylglycinamidine cyclo-ligase [Hutsoniella sourekii]
MVNAYQQAGVSVEAGYESVQRIKKHVATTHRPEVLSDLGGFGAAFSLESLNYQEPVLISGTDGVGTKLMLAIEAQTYDQIGIDCVAMCANDILAQGAQPLFFLDYLAVGKNDPEVVEAIVKGVCEGCRQAGMALIGGETAEMPGVYRHEDFDLAGFAVGIAERSQLIDQGSVKSGDILLGLPSSGIHSNGYSLVRKIFFQDHSFQLDQAVEELPLVANLGEELLKPTRIYVQALIPLIRAGLVNGIAHITGGGFVENIPRILPDGLSAVIEEGSWPVLDIFKLIAKYGQISNKEMYEIFNMGIGMVLAVSPENLDAAMGLLEESNHASYPIGQVVDHLGHDIEIG